MKPLRDKVIIKRLDADTTTKGGIYIPDSVQAKDKPNRGKVVAVGPGKTLGNGTTLELSVKVGDLVLFGRYASEVVIDGEKLVVVSEDEIQAVIEE